MKRTLRQLPAFLLLLCSLACLGHAESRGSDYLPLPDERAIYLFTEHLMEADAVTSLTGKDRRKGDWETDHFSFYGMESSGDIRVVSEAVAENTVQSIQMNALKGTSRMLVFLNVPPGSRMNLYYRVPPDPSSEDKKDESANTETAEGQEDIAPPPVHKEQPTAFIYLMAWAGKKPITRIRISTVDQNWARQTIPLKILNFFNREVPVTFVLSGDRSESVNFQFFAEVTQ